MAANFIRLGCFSVSLERTALFLYKTESNLFFSSSIRGCGNCGKEDFLLKNREKLSLYPMWITKEHPWKVFFVERVGFTDWKILSTAWIKKWKTLPFKRKIINSLWKSTFLKPSPDEWNSSASAFLWSFLFS